MIAEGKSDQEILDFMVARYGDFVHYRPPVKPTTWLLWGGPFVLPTT
jgi:cytochrome c-type biogenesis protein CcmH